MFSLDPRILDDFDFKRHEEENDSYICYLMRNYIMKTCFLIKNSFLIENISTLIEYTVFYGSIQIFQYLQFEKVKMALKQKIY